jgi:hypothetical protein
VHSPALLAGVSQEAAAAEAAAETTPPPAAAAAGTPPRVRLRVEVVEAEAPT